MVIDNCIRQAVICVVQNVDGSKFLGIKQNSDRDSNKYYFPGGGIEDGEDMISAAKRELEEELELSYDKIISIKDTKKSFTQIFSEPGRIELNYNPNEKLVAYITGQARNVVLVTVEEPSITEFSGNVEIAEAKWLTMDELKTCFKKPDQLKQILEIINNWS